MQLIDGRPVYAATDLVGFLACDHRLELERAALGGPRPQADPQRSRPSTSSRKRGIEHEQRYLEDLREAGLRVVEIDKDGSAVAPLDDRRRAAAARRRGRAARRGRADDRRDARRRRRRVPGDVLRRDLARPRGLPAPPQPRAGEPDCALGPWHYEVADTKLARHVKASAILQICSYVEQLTADPGRAARVPVRRPRREQAPHGPAPRSTTTWRTTAA